MNQLMCIRKQSFGYFVSAGAKLKSTTAVLEPRGRNPGGEECQKGPVRDGSSAGECVKGLRKTGRLRWGALLAIQLQGLRMEICMHCKSWMEICMQIKMLCKCKLGLLEVLPTKTMIYESYDMR